MMRSILLPKTSLRRLFSRHFSQLQTTLQIDQSALKNELDEPLIQHLQQRGLISNTTNDDLESLLQKTKLGLYSGADPTAKSLHLGNLLPLIVLLHFNIRGHNIVGLVGGATGAVGDPSGRSTERTAIEDQAREDNVSRISNQLTQFFNSGLRYIKFISYEKIIEEGEISSVNNHSWWKDVTLLDFLASYGRHIRVGQMLARDSVKGRLESENGIGFNEFTYQILQAYDFWHLFKNENVSIQVGGNDQWGNITAGIDLITRLKSSLAQTNKKDKILQRLAGRSSFGLTVPLLTTSSGEKFGKSAGNAVFIDPEITPSFDLYQYFIKTPDSDVAKLLKIFTFIPLKQIEEILQEHNEDPSYRSAQRILAAQITDLIHGVGASKDAEVVTSILYPLPDQPYPDITTETLVRSFKNSNILITLEKDKYFGQPYSTVVSALHGVSKNEARKLVTSGAIYQGFDRIRVSTSDSVLLSKEQLLDEQVLLLRVGKGKYYVAQFV